ncbi:MAG TPA: TetR/AcrR family transcriptional regulator [Streptosporangiaceae bacterium]
MSSDIPGGAAGGAPAGGDEGTASAGPAGVAGGSGVTGGAEVPGGAGAGAADGGGDATNGGGGAAGGGAAPRGRPRSQEADRAILTATVDLLAERGLAAMSIEEVAARAGVGKTTIYRRWPSKGLLALDAFVDSFREEQPLPDTGTLRGDLLSALHAWVRAVTQTAMGPMLTGLIAEAQHDPELRGAWRDRVLEPLREQHRVMLDRAIARGEIAASVDRDVVLDLFFGAAEHRLLLGHLPMTGEFIADVVDVILAGVPRPES